MAGGLAIEIWQLNSLKALCRVVPRKTAIVRKGNSWRGQASARFRSESFLRMVAGGAGRGGKGSAGWRFDKSGQPLLGIGEGRDPGQGRDP